MSSRFLWTISLILVTTLLVVAFQQTVTFLPPPQDRLLNQDLRGDAHAFAQDVSQVAPETDVAVHVKQDPGKLVFWVLPGQRRLGEAEWGTPQHPRALLEPVIIQAEQLPAPLNQTVPQLLQDLPILGGLPLEARETNVEGTEFTTTTGPTAVSDQGQTVEGSFDVIYRDRTPWDLPDTLTDTLDVVEATAQFTDPAGNQYELVVERLFQPPIPGWETGGGVVTNAWVHGTSGTESPLFPRVFAWGAFWGVGKVIVNGETVNENQWIHFMTTQIARNQYYQLVTQRELPLTPEEAFAHQPHHTHVIVRPVKLTPDGPVFEPVHTAFQLPNGQNQPFLHIMFEQDTIVEGPFKEWPTAMVTEQREPTTEGAAIAQEFGCTACHSSDGSARLGPTWEGLFGRQETLSDGSTVEVDEDYLRESIIEPGAKVVAGFPTGVMPQNFDQKLSDAQIQALVEYIKSLQ